MGKLALVVLSGLILASRLSAAPALPTGFYDDVMAGGLDLPTAMAWLPDGRMLVAEQKTTRVRLIVNGMVVAAPLLTVPEVELLQNEEGLVGLALDPAYPARPYVYLYFMHAGTFTNYLVMYTLTGDLSDPASTALSIDPASRYVLLDDLPNNSVNHNGGGLRFGPDGRLYLGLGDDGAGCDDSLLTGGMLRLDVSALPQPGGGPPPKTLLVPPDNPAAGDPNSDVALSIADQLRNPFRFAIDPDTGRVFIGDVGARLYEEIDLREPNAPRMHYGWQWREGPVEANPCPFIFPDLPMTDPIYYYDRTPYPGAAVIALAVYHPSGVANGVDFPPEYDGDFFLGDYLIGFIRRLKRAGDGSWPLAPPVPGQRDPNNWGTDALYAVDAAVGPDGGLWYIQQIEGGIHRIGTRPCPIVPRSGCSTPQGGRSSVLVRAASDPNTVDWSWRWSGDTALPFGDAAAHPSYTVCLYDQLADVPSPVLRVVVPSAQACPLCWKGNTRSMQYRAKIDEGVRRLSLRSRRAGGRLTVRGRSSFASPVLPFHLDTAVTVQVNGSNGNCWEARFQTSTRNDDGSFAAAIRE